MADEDEEVRKAAEALNAERAEMEKLRDKARRFDELGDIPDRLQEDPSKIYALRAAMEGRVDNPNGHRPQQAPPALTPEQMDAINKDFWANPALVSAQIAQQMANAQIQQAGNMLSPYTTATGDLFIDNFKSRKSGTDPLYKTILPVFESQLRDINRAQLLQKDDAARARELNLRWDAAAAQVYRKAAETAEREKPQNMGNSGSNGGSAPPPQTVFDKDPKTQALFNKFKAQGLLADEDIKTILEEMELENS